MKFILQCILDGFKTTIAAIFVLLVLVVPAYLTLDVSLWFAPLVVLEVFFLVGVQSRR